VAAPVPVAAAGLGSDTATQFLGAQAATGPGTRAMSPVGGGLLGTEPSTGLTSPYDGRYPEYGRHGQPQQRDRKIAVIVGAVVLALLAAIGFGVYQLLGGGTQTPETVQVPGVVNKLQSAAEDAIRAAGLTPAVKPQVTSDGNQVGKVISQDPQQGQKLARGKTVTLTVGQAPGEVDVPNVEGDTQEQAREKIKAAGLVTGDVRLENSTDPEIQQGEVIRTDPKAGKTVAKGTEVALVVADGNAKLPNVRGMKAEEARRALVGLGFTVETKNEESTESEPGTVIRQSPSAGTYPAGTTVTLVIAQKPKPTVTTEPPTPTPSETESSPEPSESASGTATP
jgi:beta-lactam-binding protein with PASTA domain